MSSPSSRSTVIKALCFLLVVDAFVLNPTKLMKSELHQSASSRILDGVELSLLTDDEYANTKDMILEKSWNNDVFKPLTEIEENLYGMPWTSSIAADENSSPPLTYMKFWEWQMCYMKEHLTNLHVLPCTSTESAYYTTSTRDFRYEENTKKKGRIVNLCLASDEYEKIRMTYYDAGRGCQVFNSLWYPRSSLNLPLLGVDLLAFGGMKYLAVVDFQPIQENEEDHSQSYEESILKPIRGKYPSLQGKMSAKFYDETQFFSKQMLFSRFDDSKIVMEELFPAFQEYVESHVTMAQTTDTQPEKVESFRQRRKEYDTYSAERDPAKGPFAAMFGEDWAEEYIHGFLFSQSKKVTE